MTALHQRLRDGYGKFEGIYVNARLGKAVGKDGEGFFFVEQENGQLSRVKETKNGEDETILYGPLRIPGKVNTGIVDINLFEILATFAEYSDDFNHEGRLLDGARYGKTFYPNADPELDYTEYNALFGKKGKTKSEEVDGLESMGVDIEKLLSITSSNLSDVADLANKGYLIFFDDKGKISRLVRANGYEYTGSPNVYKKDGKTYKINGVNWKKPLVEVTESTDADTNQSSVDHALSEVHELRSDISKGARIETKEIIEELKDIEEEILQRLLTFDDIKDFIEEKNRKGLRDNLLYRIVDVINRNGKHIQDLNGEDGAVVSGKMLLFYNLVYQSGAMGTNSDNINACNISV